MVGGRFSKQGDLYLRLVLSSSKMSKSTQLPARILKVYIETLIGFRLISSPDCLNTLLSQGCILETAPAVEVGGTHSKDMGEDELVVQLGVMSS